MNSFISRLVSRLSGKEKAQGHKAQGMVEFALILPLLLLLLFGIIELGRMFLIYVSVSAASREAARYASAAGESATINVDFYEDCTGIRAAAKRIGFFAGLQDEQILIAYDNGPGTPFFANVCSPAKGETVPDTCFGGPYSFPADGEVTLGSRVRVCVMSQFEPLLGLVPLQPFSMRATTARTVIKALSISEAPPTGTNPVITIPWPLNKASFAQGDDISFDGLAVDAEDGDISNKIEWISDIDGILAQNSASFSTAFLTPGTHTITAQVVDSTGRIASKTITITVVPNVSAPVVTISCVFTDPVYEGQSISCAASAIDAEDGDISDQIQWMSSRDGNIGTGPGLLIYTLSVGRHTIRAWVVDSDGLVGFAEYKYVEILPNTPPEIYIDWPLNGSRWAAGVDTIEFIGRALDVQDGDLTASITWTSNPIGSFPGATGGTFFWLPQIIDVGTHIITARVTDSGGLTSETSITLIIEDNNPPSVQIIAPPNGWIFAYTYPINFRGSAIDSIDGDISADLEWESSEDGPFGSGETFSYSGLSTGTHTIRAYVVDSHGNPAEDTVEITIIAGTPPTVTITAPADGSLHNEGDMVTFTGTAIDEEDGDLSAGITWESDVDGVLGTGASISIDTLTPGEHVITAYVQDSEKLYGTDTITVIINAAPVVEILTPPDSSTFRFDDIVNFSGSATDTEDGDLSGSIKWTSDIDGDLGTGASVSKTGMTAGTHVITAQVTDLDGAVGTATITIVVNPNPCVIEKLGYTVDQSAKTIIWNLRNNNTQASYTLERLTIPWDQNPAGTQSLLSVTFGGSLLWSGADTSAGTRFGPDAAAEYVWTIGAGHTFDQPAAPATYVDQDLVFIFSDPANYINKLTIAVFVNDLTGDICNVMVSFSP